MLAVNADPVVFDRVVASPWAQRATAAFLFVVPWVVWSGVVSSTAEVPGNSR